MLTLKPSLKWVSQGLQGSQVSILQPLWHGGSSDLHEMSLLEGDLGSSRGSGQIKLNMCVGYVAYSKTWIVKLKEATLEEQGGHIKESDTLPEWPGCIDTWGMSCPQMMACYWKDKGLSFDLAPRRSIWSAYTMATCQQRSLGEPDWILISQITQGGAKSAHPAHTLPKNHYMLTMCHSSPGRE